MFSNFYPLRQLHRQSLYHDAYCQNMSVFFLWHKNENLERPHDGEINNGHKGSVNTSHNSD